MRISAPATAVPDLSYKPLSFSCLRVLKYDIYFQTLCKGLFLVFFQLKEQKTSFAKKHKVIYLSINRVRENVGCHNVRILFKLILQKTLHLLPVEGTIHLGRAQGILPEYY